MAIKEKKVTLHLFNKGECFVDVMGWYGIVVEATRGTDPAIVPCTEIFGYEHECGSIYVNEISRKVTVEEFEKNHLHQGDKYYFKGKLLDPIPTPAGSYK